MEGKLTLENYCCPECKNKEFYYCMYEGRVTAGYEDINFLKVDFVCLKCKKDYSASGEDAHDIEYALEYIPEVEE